MGIMSIRVSVIIVGYNSRADLEKCLPSLLLSLNPQLDEVIVVDNASSDGTTSWLAKAYPHIKLIPCSTNLGFAAGNNLGAHNAFGEYLAFLNPDTQVEHFWLEELITGLQSGPSVGLATSKILMMDNPKIINTCGNQTHITGLTLCRGVGQPSESFTQVERVNAISGAAFIIRRELFQTLGGFDEVMFTYMEDTDLSLRARLAGYHSVLVPSSIVYHRYKLHFGPRKVFYEERNRYRMLLKLLEPATLIRNLPLWFLAELVTWGFVLVREPHRFYNKLLAYGSILLQLHEIIKLHSAVQSLRAISDVELLSEWHTCLCYAQIGISFSTMFANKVFHPLFDLLNRRINQPACLVSQKESIQ
jgi:GT2 family glycosyltransferase